MRNREAIIAGGILLLIVFVFFLVNLSGEGNVNLRNSASLGIVRNLKSTDVTGMYTVKKDKNSRLLLNENGTYNFNINVCDGYLELTGQYEVRDKNIYLINKVIYEDYPSLKDNEEFHLSIIDENTIELEEDLVCLFGETLFEK